MIRKLRAGMMPPPGARRPDAATIKAFVDALEAQMDAAAALNPNPGLASVPAAEPRRVRAARQGSARHRRRRQRVPAARHDQQRLRQRRRRAGVLADADGKLPARGEPDQPPRDRRPRRERRPRRPTRSAATGRRCATSTARRWARAAASRSSTPSRPTATTSFKVSLHNEPLGGFYGRTTMATLDIKEQIEVSVNGERAALLDLNPRMSETDPKNSLEMKTPPIHVDGRPAAHLGGVHPALRRPGRRPAGAAREHAGRQQIGITLRRHRAAAHARLHDPRAATTSPASPTRASRRMVFTCRPTRRPTKRPAPPTSSSV